MLRNLILLLFMLTTVHSLCQDGIEKPIRQQLGFMCDNNFLLFNGDDGYHTSGMFLRYDRVSGRTNDNRKEILSYELGQLIYTAYSRKILPTRSSQFPGGIDQIDRPIAGYLYGKVSRSLFMMIGKCFRLVYHWELLARIHLAAAFRNPGTR
jgi:hypothetical protein